MSRGNCNIRSCTAILLTFLSTSCGTVEFLGETYITEFRVLDANSGLPVSGTVISATAEELTSDIGLLQGPNAHIISAPSNSNGLTWIPFELVTHNDLPNTNGLRWMPCELTTQGDLPNPQTGVRWHLAVRNGELSDNVVLDNLPTAFASENQFRIEIASICGELPAPSEPSVGLTGLLEVHSYVQSMVVCDHSQGQVTRVFYAEASASYVGAIDVFGPIEGFRAYDEPPTPRRCANEAEMSNCGLTITIGYPDKPFDRYVDVGANIGSNGELLPCRDTDENL